MLFTHLAVVVLFVVLGILFLRGKGAFLIAGYNTSSKAEKQKYDEKALCRFMGRSMFALAACWAISALSEPAGNMIPFWIGLGLFFAVIAFMVIYANTGNRFRK
jgi:preprotein translocase subunit SecG